MAIRKRGNQYQVTDRSGKKILGKHKTRKAAMRQLRAIEASKRR